MSRIRSSVLAIGGRYAFAKRLRSVIDWHSTASVLQASDVVAVTSEWTMGTVLLRRADMITERSLL